MKRVLNSVNTLRLYLCFKVVFSSGHFGPGGLRAPLGRVNFKGKNHFIRLLWCVMFRAKAFELCSSDEIIAFLMLYPLQRFKKKSKLGHFLV